MDTAGVLWLNVGGPRAALTGANALHLHAAGQNQTQVSSDQCGQLLTEELDLKPGDLKWVVIG